MDELVFSFELSKVDLCIEGGKALQRAQNAANEHFGSLAFVDSFDQLPDDGLRLNFKKMEECDVCHKLFLEKD